jgi:hypothetical protein
MEHRGLRNGVERSRGRSSWGQAGKSAGRAADLSQEMIYAPARDWADLVITEMSLFPFGKYDDLTDSSSQGLKYLRDAGLAQSDEEAASGRDRDGDASAKAAPLIPLLIPQSAIPE